MTVVAATGVSFDFEAPLLIVGAGAAGLCAALAAKEAGIDPVVIERDALPSGSTALSAGLIPAAGTRFQRAKGIDDSAVLFAGDIQRKAHGESDPAIVMTVAEQSGPLVEWLADRYDMPFDVVEGFNYAGHSALRMHGLPGGTGRELIDRLRGAVEDREIVVLTESVVDRLYVGDGDLIRGVEIARGDGTRERIGCRALVLACNGYGGHSDLVRRFIPEMADALYFGHPGNRGDAVLWGEALGAGLRHLSGYQGHGSVATPHNILITWAAIIQGGFQVNHHGHRFCDESQGYSEAAAEVLRQPGGVVWNVFDGRIAAIAEQFEDFRAAGRARAVVSANSRDELADAMGMPADAFIATWDEVEAAKAAGDRDRFGRKFETEQKLTPPYCAVRVTGALFHTQGGLAVDASARVLRNDASPFPNLFAAGGAAAGVSGDTAAGYLSGNGLLTATTLGRLAGQSAARLVLSDPE